MVLNSLVVIDFKYAAKLFPSPVIAVLKTTSMSVLSRRRTVSAWCQDNCQFPGKAIPSGVATVLE